MTQSGPLLFDKEIRLGLVLYGGVSLAVYENGVAQEFFRAVKGEGVYGIIKDWLRSDIVVDIISGTSAGGINGILLSHALANNLEFRDTSRLWRENGDLLALIRSPDSTATTSVLDSEEYYQPMIVKAFQTMPKYSTPPFSRPSPIEEIDLFVTGTDVDGQRYSVFDDNGHIIDIKNHRRVFKLSYRAGRKNEFATDDDTLEALGKLCRLTSCFPVAFTPVDVNINSDAEPVDKKLDRWGNLDGDKAYFLDGGLLDNKPFSYTIDSIFRRVANREVERWLLYVEPDPERFTKTTPIQPNVIDAALKALIGIPGYESIGQDLRVIAEHNNRLDHFQDLQSVVSPMQALSADRTAVSQPDDRVSAIYRRARLTQLLDRILEGIFKERGKLIAIPSALRDAADRLASRFKEWESQLGDEILHQYDVYYRQRVVNHLIYSLYEKLYNPSDSEPLDVQTANGYRQLWGGLNHLSKMLEIIRFAMESLVDNVDFHWQNRDVDQIWAELQQRFDALLSGSFGQFFVAVVSHSAIQDTISKELRREYAEFLNSQRERCSREEIYPKSDGPSAIQLIDQELELLLRFNVNANDPLCYEFTRFPVIDAYLFPMKQMAGIESQDHIRVVRVSPVDAQRQYSHRNLRDKLCGETLGHFSGFLSRPWRSNDIFWGRLDAACQLIECIVGKGTIPLMRTSLDNLAAAFPNSDAKTLHADLITAGTDNEKIIDLLAEAAQREIIIEEVPRVVQDSIAQQRAWNEYKIANVSSNPTLPFDIKSLAWTMGIKEMDHTVLNFASVQFTHKLPPDSWLEFFREHYAVGSEEFYEAVPTPVLVEMASKAGAVLENCIIAAGGKDLEETAKSNKLFRLGFHYPLRALYKFSHWLRVAPSFNQITIASLFIFAATVLALTIIFWQELIYPTSSGFSLARVIILLAAPAFTILFMIWLVGTHKIRKESPSNSSVP